MEGVVNRIWQGFLQSSSSTMPSNGIRWLEISSDTLMVSHVVLPNVHR
jgi:hypothetical protein